MVTVVANAETRRIPSRAMLTTPPRSLNAAPSAGSAYGIEMRRVWARNATVRNVSDMRRRRLPSQLIDVDPSLEHARQYDEEDDDHRLEDVDDLLRDERVHRESAVFQEPEAERRRDDPARVVL